MAEMASKQEIELVLNELRLVLRKRCRSVRMMLTISLYLCYSYCLELEQKNMGNAIDLTEDLFDNFITKLRKQPSLRGGLFQRVQ